MIRCRCYSTRAAGVVAELLSIDASLLYLWNRKLVAKGGPVCVTSTVLAQT